MTESSKNCDLPPVLKPEFEKRLARVFAYLRQHDRKAKLARKTAELNTLKDHARRAAAAPGVGGVAVVRRASGLSDNEVPQQDLFHDLHGEAKTTRDMPPRDEKTELLTAELERDLEELRKQINFKDFDTSGVIAATDLSSALRALNRPLPKAEVQWMIWEVDDDLDGCIDWDEFRGAYARCAIDKQGTEPNQVFYLIQFLLSDPDGGGSVSVIDLKTELQRIRGTDHLTTKIKKALGVNTEQQEQEKHPLGLYLDAMLTHLPASFATSSHFPPKQ